MNISIGGIFDRGKPNYERLHLRVNATTNLKFFVVFDTVALPEGGVSTVPLHVYWFADRLVSAGDNVFLFTGPGVISSLPMPGGGGTNHFIYWNQPKTIWGVQSSRAVLLEVSEWRTSAP